MKIRKVINETQKRYVNENINTEIACKQHQHLLQVLHQYNIRTYLLPTVSHLPEQVFTRDIGFAISNKLFLAKMKYNIRKEERDLFGQWLLQKRIHAVKMKHVIEGGDVIVDGNKVFVGQSSRTSSEAVDELKQHLPNYHIYSLKFNPAYLHLDCVFQPISTDEALIYSPAFQSDERNFLKSIYDTIDVTEKEQFTLGTNILSIGNKTIISLSINKEVNRQLEKRGYKIIPLDITEIIKSGGSFRCITLPILREHVSFHPE